MKELFIPFSIIFISILIGILLCYFGEKSDEKEGQKQYLKNTSNSSDRQVIYLSLDKIKEFYYLRPEKYKFKYNYSGFYYLNSRGYNIYVKDFKEQDEFKKWMQHSNMVEFLEKVVKADIRHVKQLADEQFQQARKTAEEVSERLKDEEI